MKKSDILKAVAAEAKAKSKPVKKADKNEPWRLVAKAFNEAYFEKYSVNGVVGADVKVKPSAQKVLEAYNNNIDLACKAAAFYVTFYQELPFVNLKVYKRPLLGGLSVFAPQLQEYMDRGREERISKLERANTVDNFKIRSLFDD